MEHDSALITGRRIAAFLVDHVIISFICIIPFMSSSLLSMENGMDHFFSGLTLVMAAGFVCYALKDIFGRSLGKRLFGLKLVTTDDPQTPKMINRVLRNLTIFIWPVEAIVMLNNPDRRRLGDRLGHTMVVSA